MSKFRDLISVVWGVRAKKVRSPLNGKLEVWYVNKRYSLDAENVNYSFGSLHRLFQQIFLEVGIRDRNPRDVLLLGVGAGSVISIIRNELRLTSHITGVEHDPEVLKIGNEYFRLNSYSGVDIAISDAFKFMSKNEKAFDLIVIDLFHDEDVPDKFQTEAFIDFCIRSLSPGAMLIYNFIAQSRKQKKQFEELKKVFQAKPGKITINEILGTNKVITLKDVPFF